MQTAKTLNPASFKAICNQTKFSGGAELLAALTALDKLADDAFDAADKALDKVGSGIAALLKDKAAQALAPLSRQLKDMQADAQGARADLKKRRAEVEQDAALGESVDARTVAALSRLKSSPEPYHIIVNLSPPLDWVLISRSTISSKHREQLTALSGSKQFSKPGTVRREANLLQVDIPGASGGMAGRIRNALKKRCGQSFKVAVGADVAEEEAEATAKPPATTAAVKPPATPAAAKPPATAAAAKPPATPAAAKPPVALAKAPLLWKGASDLIGKRIGLLKDAVRQHYGGHGAALLGEIDRNLAKLDAVADRFDDRLVKALEAVNRAPAPQRAAEVKKARALAAEYAQYIKDEPMVDHMDGNPFGVPTQIEKLVSASLAELDRALA